MLAPKRIRHRKVQRGSMKGHAKGNTELLNAINGALEELQADGTLQSIVDKYIKAE